MSLEKRIQQELVPEPQNIKSSLRKVIVFILVVTALAAIYQVLIYNFVLPNREIIWQRASLEQVQAFDKQGRRFAVLIMLEQDIGDSGRPLAVFQDPIVRQEFNLLRLNPLVLPIQADDEELMAWYKDQGFTRLPALLIYASGYPEPVTLNADQLQPDELQKTLNAIRFQRYER